MPRKARIPPLPDTTKWLPRSSRSESLKSVLLQRCKNVEDSILARAKHEMSLNIDNFDSGSGVEDLIREGLRELLPLRYSVKAGVVNDRYGNTAGDFEVVIFNDIWFPLIKSGATAHSRRIHLPIDGVYGIAEVKQTLDYRTLDDAMAKLVACHRLHRPKTHKDRLTENRESTPCVHGLTNPLYSMVIATDVRKGIDIDLLVERFFSVNQTLERLSVVRALCILGQGTVTWGYDQTSSSGGPAMFMLEDLYRPIYPVYSKVPKGTDSAFYSLVLDLSLCLYHAVLAPEDIVASYGPAEFHPARPVSSEISIPPDPAWLKLLEQFCPVGHDFATSVRNGQVRNLPRTSQETSFEQESPFRKSKR